MQLRRAIIAGIVTFVVVFTFIFIRERPAFAASCQYPHHVCLYSGQNLTGSWARWDVYGGIGQCTTLNGYTLNNNIESIYGNYSNRIIQYWDTANCTGTVIFWSRGGRYDYIGVDANKISSFKRCATAVPC